MKMLTDNPITDVDSDQYGFKPYAEILAETVNDTDDLPYCIGIFGAWGTGKSSLMHMIEKIVDENNQIKTIWFNPWKYDKKEDLWNALIQTILYKIAEDSSEEDVKTKAKNLAKSTAWLLLKKGVSSLTSGIISSDDIETIKEKFVEQDELHYRHINHFENNFEDVIDTYTDNGKLVIFIDDLDRCLPENAITVLESLKLFIGNAKCIFVLAMDRNVIEAGLKYRFRGVLDISGRDYMDKIIQVPFFLPPIPFQKLRSALKVTKSVDYDDSIWRLIELGLESNPRKCKRFVNCFYLLNKILRTPDIVADSGPSLQNINVKIQSFYLAKLLILQITHNEFYSLLTAHPNAWDDFENELFDPESHLSEEEISNRFPQLARFWKDTTFKLFMANTAHSQNFPVAPKQELIVPLIHAINLVGPELEVKSSVSNIAAQKVGTSASSSSSSSSSSGSSGSSGPSGPTTTT